MDWIYFKVIVEVNKVVGYIYRVENFKNHFKIVGQIIFIKKKNNMSADMAQRESSSIKCSVSTFSNIYI